MDDSIECVDLQINEVFRKDKRKNDQIELEQEVPQKIQKIENGLIQYLTDNEWKKLLNEEFHSDYFLKLESFIEEQREKLEVLKHNVFPPNELIFNVYNQCPLSKVKVVIVGYYNFLYTFNERQDPYHGIGQAMGVSFGVKKGCKIPPSLANIYKELANDIPEFKIPTHGDISNWVKQGVFMLNACLTVSQGQPNSHQGKGWEIFTDKTLQIIAERNEFVVFILWGAFAQKKEEIINRAYTSSNRKCNGKHYVLKSPHPSPFSCSGFFKTKPFSKTNTALKTKGLEPIDWTL